MKKLLLFFAVLIAVGIYLLYFTPSERKASYVFEGMALIKPGMSRKQTVKILSEPDTIYEWTENNYSSLVLDYNMGFAAPDNVRVILKHDSVVGVEYNQ